MDLRSKLFFQKNPYCLETTREVFFEAVKQNLAWHIEGCPEYARMLGSRGFSLDGLKSEEDLYRIPPLPTLYFKRNRIFTAPQEKLAFKVTSSGTTGRRSEIGFDRSTLFYGVGMMIRFFSYYGVISPVPANYVMLGYEPDDELSLGAARTAYGTSRFAPALNRVYALKRAAGGECEPDIEGLAAALERFSKSAFPVRFVGFPAYMYFLVKELEGRGISLRLAKGSKVILGGGWKRFSNEEIPRGELYGLIRSALGIEKENCLEFYSAVEHPLPYVKCGNGRFHLPIYSRAIVRDINTLEPVKDGTTGLLSFVTPLVSSLPLTSVVTDDLAALHDGTGCGCGITTPYFELRGRAGVREIKTCAETAAR